MFGVHAHDPQRPGHHSDRVWPAVRPRSLSGLATAWIAVIRPSATTVVTAAIGFPPAVTSIPELGQVAAHGGREEPPGDLALLGGVHVESWPPRLDVFARPVHELPGRCVGAADRAGDLGMGEPEYLMQNEDGALLGCQRLEHHQHGQRHRFG